MSATQQHNTYIRKVLLTIMTNNILRANWVWQFVASQVLHDTFASHSCLRLHAVAGQSSCGRGSEQELQTPFCLFYVGRSLGPLRQGLEQLAAGNWSQPNWPPYEFFLRHGHHYCEILYWNKIIKDTSFTWTRTLHCLLFLYRQIVTWSAVKNTDLSITYTYAVFPSPWQIYFMPFL